MSKQRAVNKIFTSEAKDELDRIVYIDSGDMTVRRIPRWTSHHLAHEDIDIRNIIINNNQDFQSDVRYVWRMPSAWQDISDYIVKVQLGSRLQKTDKNTLIERVPGFGLRDFLGHFCQKKFRERVLEGLHAEAIADYQDALANGNLTRAKYIRKMIPVWLLLSMFGGLLSWIAGKLTLKVGSTSE